MIADDADHTHADDVTPLPPRRRRAMRRCMMLLPYYFTPLADMLDAEILMRRVYFSATRACFTMIFYVFVCSRQRAATLICHYFTPAGFCCYAYTRLPRHAAAIDTLMPPPDFR